MHLPHGWRFRRTTIITVGLLAFLAGVGLARTGIYLTVAWIVVSTLLALATLKKKNFISLLTIGLLGLTLGWWRGSIALRQLQWYQRYSNQIVELQATADDDAVYGDKSQITFDGSHLQADGQALVGKVKVAGYGESAIYRGDRVRISGKLFVTRGSHQASLSFADIHVLSRDHSLVNRLRRDFNAGTFSALPEPQASFGLGLLIGERNTLPTNVSNQLAAVGLTHLIAVSGYNLTILLDVARRLLGKRSKYQFTILSLGLIGGFLLLAGASASIVRAALVSGLSLLAWYYGRRFRPIVLLMLVAALTVAYSPLYLWSDIGWYLSFLAFFGILILAPLVLRRVYGTRQPSGLVLLMTESACAQVMTLPLIMYVFGRVSLLAIPANMLVLPLVPIAMLASLLAGLAGAAASTIAGWFAWPARALLTYMLDVVSLIAKVPHTLQAVSLNIWELIILYGLVSLVTLVLWRKSHLKNDIITERKVLKIKGAIE